MFLFTGPDTAFGRKIKLDFGTVYTLWLREVVRFVRQPSRLLGAIASPFVFWIFIGSGIGRSFRAEVHGKGVEYLEFFFPGTVILILLFTAIFSTISIIEDRKEGFLQSVLVAPVSRSTFVAGKILGGATLATFQGLLFFAIYPSLTFELGFGSWLICLLILFMNAFFLTGLGFLIAWRMHSIQGFHAVMNLFLMPLWFLSGSLFPENGAPVWVAAAMKVNPLAYGTNALRAALYQGSAAGIMKDAGVVFFFGLLIFIFSVLITSKRDANALP